MQAGLPVVAGTAGGDFSDGSPASDAITNTDTRAFSVVSDHLLSSGAEDDVHLVCTSAGFVVGD